MYSNVKKLLFTFVNFVDDEKPVKNKHICFSRLITYITSYINFKDFHSDSCPFSQNSLCSEAIFTAISRGALGCDMIFRYFKLFSLYKYCYMLHTSCEITEKRIETNLCHGGVQTRLKAPIINVLKHTQRIMSALYFLPNLQK